MPNCTAYAYGRAYEILGKKPNLCPYNAGEWYNYNKKYGYYSYGSTPKLGAIAVWDNYDGDTGHVAVVEAISGTQVTISESAWNGTSFFTQTVSSNDSHFGYSRMRFLGFIYIGSFSAPSGGGEGGNNTATNQSPGEVWRVTSSDGVNLRTGAGTSYSRILTIPVNANIRVSQKKTADGYTWGKVTYSGKSGWCVLNYGYKIGLIGDANGDGKLDLYDIETMQKYNSELISLSSTKKILADTNNDSKIDGYDYLKLQKYMGELISTMA